MRMAIRIGGLLLLCALAHTGLRWLALRYPIECGDVDNDRQFERQKNDIQTLFVGNSHILFCVVPEDFPRSYVLGSLGETYAVVYYRLRHALATCPPALKTVVVHCDLQSLAPLPQEQTKQIYWAQHIDYLDLARRQGDAWSLFHDWAKARAFPYAGRAELCLNALSVPRNEKMATSKATANRNFALMSDREAQARRCVAKHFGQGQWYSEVTAQYLTDILDLCAERQLNVVLIEFPVTQIYHELAQKAVPCDEIEARLGALTEARPNVHVLHLRDMFFGRDELFLDADHVNLTGTALLSQRLKAEFARRGIPGGA